MKLSYFYEEGVIYLSIQINGTVWNILKSRIISKKYGFTTTLLVSVNNVFLMSFSS